MCPDAVYAFYRVASLSGSRHKVARLKADLSKVGQNAKEVHHKLAVAQRETKRQMELASAQSLGKEGKVHELIYKLEASTAGHTEELIQAFNARGEMLKSVMVAKKRVEAERAEKMPLHRELSEEARQRYGVLCDEYASLEALYQDSVDIMEHNSVMRKIDNEIAAHDELVDEDLKPAIGVLEEALRSGTRAGYTWQSLAGGGSWPFNESALQA